MESTESPYREIDDSQFFVIPSRSFTVAQRIQLYALIGLTIWVLTVTLKIELLNYQSGFYLPRTDNDGTWRVWGGDPNSYLRGWVSTFGLLQYILAPILLGLAIHAFHFLRKNTWRWLALTAGLIAITAFSLAFYRGYYTSLGG